MQENKAAELARKIYRSHRKALDFIFEHRHDPISDGTSMMNEFLATHAAELGIMMVDPQNKGYVRFIPKEWDVPQNNWGTAWGPNSKVVLCEISFWTRNAELQIVVGDAPDAWADRVWQRAASKPFKQEWKKLQRVIFVCAICPHEPDLLRPFSREPRNDPQQNGLPELGRETTERLP